MTSRDPDPPDDDAESRGTLVRDALRWRALTKDTFDYIFVIDEELRFRYGNAFAPGVDPRDVLGTMTPLDFIPEQDIPRIGAILGRVISAQSTERYDVQIPVLNRWYNTVAVGYLDENGQAGAILLTRDLSALKQAERELQRHRDNLDELVRARTLALEAANECLAVMACTDPLTGLLNRREILDRLSNEVARGERYGSELSLIMIDLDHFKTVNDTRGHLVGDAVLERVADVLRAALRTSDANGRYGGEEFLIVMPETGDAGAQQVAERLRHAIKSVRHDDNGDAFTVTCSAGVATWRPGRSATELLREADEALLTAKRTGRDRVVVA